MATNHLQRLQAVGEEILDNGYDGGITDLVDRLFDEAGIDDPADDETDDLAWNLRAYRQRVR